MRRYANKRDANEADIVKALERAGAYVWRLHTPCDLLIYRARQFYTLEVKEPNARLRKDQPEQAEFLRVTGTAVVRTPEEALLAIGALK